MPLGPGKYDDLATLVRERSKATGVIVIIIGGDRGEGFSVQADLATTLRLPLILRHVADNMDLDLPKV